MSSRSPDQSGLASSGFRTITVRVQQRALSESGPLSPVAAPPAPGSLLDLQAQLIALQMENHELKESQAAAQRSRNRYFEIFDLAPVPCFVFDARHNIQELNLAGAELLGGDRARFVHRPFFTHLSEVDRSAFHQHVAAVLARRERLDMELNLVRADGSVDTVHAFSQPIAANPGEQAVCLSALLSVPRACQTATTHGAESMTAEECLNGVQGKVLLVDDEHGVRTVAAKMIEALGFQVDEAEGGREAFRLFLSEPSSYHLVVADLTMPEMDGWELMAQVRHVRPGVPFVMMSGLTEAHSVLEGNGQALEAFLQKPFTMARLQEVLAMAVSFARRTGAYR